MGGDMVTRIRAGIDAMRDAFDEHGVPDEVREVCETQYLAIAYEWCDYNATCRGLEEFMKEERPAEYKRLISGFLRSATFHETARKVMDETFPHEYVEVRDLMDELGEGGGR